MYKTGKSQFNNIHFYSKKPQYDVPFSNGLFDYTIIVYKIICHNFRHKIHK